MRVSDTLIGLSVALAVAGCQCFVPVDELDAGPDTGIDAGVDAGIDAGSSTDDGGCERASQCLLGPMPSGWCGASPPDAGYSCVANACLWECPTAGAGRSCIVDMGSYCLRCADDAGSACPTSTHCGPTTSTAFVAASSTCTTWPGTTIPFESVSIMRTASASCRFIVSGANQSLGEFWRLDDGEYLAYFPGFGGWCTGRSAFTGVPRGIFTCPDCQFGLEGFE